MTKVLVVDDSRFFRRFLEKELSKRGYTVLTARTGKQAVEAVLSTDPDVVTMDLIMPGMDGIETTRQVMKKSPVPIIMLSANGAESTFDALEYGAVDFIEKGDDTLSVGSDAMIDKLVKQIEAVKGVDTSSLPDPEVDASQDTAVREKSPVPVSDEEIDALSSPVIVIGASTGGPQIIERLLSELPRSLDARVLVVQHMPDSFTSRFAERLNRTSEYQVREASASDTVPPGVVLVASGNKNLHVIEDHDSDLQVQSVASEGNSPTPSIDVTMQTVADVVSSPCVGIILSGMGDDGSKGVKAIKEAGGITIAQDKETSPVFGMPRRAMQSGGIDHAIPDNMLVSGVINNLTPVRGDVNHG